MAKELNEAKAKFEAVSKGRYYPKRMTPEEAKKRLVETDIGLDISAFLAARDEASLKRAGWSLLIEAADIRTLSYFSPLIETAAGAILRLLDNKEPSKKS